MEKFWFQDISIFSHYSKLNPSGGRIAYFHVCFWQFHEELTYKFLVVQPYQFKSRIEPVDYTALFVFEVRNCHISTKNC